MTIKNLSLICAAFDLSTVEATEGDYWQLLIDDKNVTNIAGWDVTANGRCIAASASVAA